VQKGQVFRTGGSWYLRFYQDDRMDDRFVKRVCKRLAYSDPLHGGRSVRNCEGNEKTEKCGGQRMGKDQDAFSTV
jgi:hypothetical protein